MVGTDTLPADGQLIRFKFFRPLFGHDPDYVGRYFGSGPGRIGQGVYGRNSDGSFGKKCRWSSVIEWWPLDG